jgi:hypothetical protein
MTATMSDGILAKVDKAVDEVRPEAVEYLRILDGEQIRTTKDSYGNVMALLSKLGGGEMAALFLIALVREGYPLGTAESLSGIMGFPATIPPLLQRAANQRRTNEGE